MYCGENGMMDFNRGCLRAVGVTAGSLIALRRYSSDRVSVCVMISSGECAGFIMGPDYTMDWLADEGDSEFERLE
jgi:hypothetical protein